MKNYLFILLGTLFSLSTLAQTWDCSVIEGTTEIIKNKECNENRFCVSMARCKQKNGDFVDTKVFCKVDNYLNCQDVNECIKDLYSEKGAISMSLFTEGKNPGNYLLRNCNKETRNSRDYSFSKLCNVVSGGPASEGKDDVWYFRIERPEPATMTACPGGGGQMTSQTR